MNIAILQNCMPGTDPGTDNKSNFLSWPAFPNSVSSLITVVVVFVVFVVADVCRR